ncbi:thrombospondin type-1 domain-containing protein 4-like isoform X2 [Ptychodera flava]|uniref:thrombospondin type-1 domain-containing protein 4-like isoform X2 n=1 Tax=Ptychodera flava TaxID=63121 RepID=UPI00396A77E5
MKKQTIWWMGVQTCVLLVLLVSISVWAGDIPKTLRRYRRDSSSTTSLWGDWGPWSECSRTCGGGIAEQTRPCLRRKVGSKFFNVGQHWNCVGLFQQYKSCNTQKCPDSSSDFRQLQCEEFNDKPFMGKLYEWEPFLKAPNPCALNCRAKGYRFYAKQADKVIDGTPCQPGSDDICVNGQCKKVGCDGILGSNTKLDQCGICGGDNSQCTLMSGTFDTATMNVGYNMVVKIPEGATRINVTEMARSRNYLAVKGPNGKGYINSDWSIDIPGKYLVAGTMFEYRRPLTPTSSVGELLLADGPTNEEVDIMLIYQQQNPGVHYEYIMPLEGRGTRPSSAPQSSNSRNVQADDDNTNSQRGYPSRGSGTNTNSNQPRLPSNSAGTSSGSNYNVGSYGRTYSNGRSYGSAGTLQNRYGSTSRYQPSTGRGVYTGPSYPGLYGSSNSYGSRTSQGYSGGASRSTGYGAGRNYGVQPPYGGTSGQRQTYNYGRGYPGYGAQGYGSAGTSQRRYSGGSTYPPNSYGGRSYPGTGYDYRAGSYPYSSYQGGSLSRNPYPGTYNSQNANSGSNSRNPYPGNSNSQGASRDSDSRNTYGDSSNPRQGLNPGSSPRGSQSVNPGSSGRNPSLGSSSPRGGNPGSNPGTSIRTNPYLGNANRQNLNPGANPYAGSPQAGNSGASPRGPYPGNAQSGNPGAVSGRGEPVPADSQPSYQPASGVSGDESNPGFFSPEFYEWKETDKTECTVSCAGGTQQSIVKCVIENTMSVVPDSNCDDRFKPPPAMLQCNTDPCPARWESGAWSACSRTCDEGVQVRQVSCKQKQTEIIDNLVAEINCPASEVPDSRQPCNLGDCPAWKTTQWDQCSVRCGLGTHSRKVTCEDGTGAVDESLCEDFPKPVDKEECDMGSCARQWYHSDWSDLCSEQCGEGVYSRPVICAVAGEGDAVSDDECQSEDKPSDSKPCNMGPCAAQWFTGSWTQCSAECGDGSQTRAVACMLMSGADHTVVSTSLCEESEKPATIQACNIKPCESQWFITSWSECSKTCGSGHRTREVKCLDGEKQNSLSCDENKKPHARHSCNTTPCPTVAPKRKSNDCKDRFSNCNIVVQARLCNYPYYKKACCSSCFGR